MSTGQYHLRKQMGSRFNQGKLIIPFAYANGTDLITVEESHEERQARILCACRSVYQQGDR